MNALGVDVRGLDVAAFLAASRTLFPLAALAWLALVAAARRPSLALAGVVGANAWVWLVTNFPLQRLYGVGVSSDRLGNLGFCAVVAAGNPPLSTFQVGQLHFEPFWGVLVALLSGFEPARVLRLYPFLPLALASGVALALFAALRPLADAEGRPGGWGPWERVAVAGFATLLSSAPFDHQGLYRVPWALTFLLKPNHAVGLVLFPFVLRAVAGARTTRERIAAGLLLHLLAWAFVLHMAFAAVGLVVFAGLALLERRRGAWRDAGDVAVVIGVNVAIVSPYLVMLVVGYPFLVPSPVMVIPEASPHLLEVTGWTSVLFALALWGLRVLHRRGDRLSRLWMAQVVGALLSWTLYLGLSAIQMARQRDEIFYWTRILVAVAAAFGAWDLLARARSRVTALAAEPARAVALAALVLPWSMPYWWNPARMDSYFNGSVPPLPALIEGPTDFVRAHTERDAVVAGDRDYARYVAALGGRRVLLTTNLHRPKDVARRERLLDALVRRTDPESVEEARRYHVRYLLVTSRFLAGYPGVELGDLERRAALERVHLHREADGTYVAVFRIRPAPRAT